MRDRSLGLTGHTIPTSTNGVHSRPNAALSRAADFVDIVIAGQSPEGLTMPIVSSIISSLSGAARTSAHHRHGEKDARDRGKDPKKPGTS